MDYMFSDVYDFEQKYPTREAREKALTMMDSEEIRHIACSCRTAQGKLYYTRFADQKAFRELIAPIVEDLERVWRKGQQVRGYGPADGQDVS